MPARRCGGCVSTAWYTPTCEMLNTRSAVRQVAPRSMRRSPRALHVFFSSFMVNRALGAAVETLRGQSACPLVDQAAV